MATIVKKTEGLKLLGYNTGLFKKLDESFNTYKKSLKPAREKVSKDYKDLTNQPENKKNGYSYPDVKVFNFEENYLGDLVLIQEQLLRMQIIKALPLQSFQKLHLYDILPVSARQVLSGAFCLVLRYKRLYDLFFRAAAIREKTEAIDFKFGFDSEPRKEIKDKYHFIVSRAVTAFPEFYNWVNHKILKDNFNDLANGILYLKGGDLQVEFGNHYNKAVFYDLKNYFEEEFFETKKVVHYKL